MGGRHDGPVELVHEGDTAVHRLPARVKITATLLFVLAVVATPAHAVWALAVDAAVVVGVALAARLPGRVLLRRMRIELPFLAFALFLPVVGRGPHVEVFGVTLSEPGLWGAWNIVAKGSIGALAAIVLAATTPVAELLHGLDELHLPRALVAIAGFMVRYLDVVAQQADRLRVARLSRAGDPRWLWQASGVAATAGTLFVRSYERGERVQLAMAARGYTGSMPSLHHHVPVRAAWSWVVAAPGVAVAAMVVARLMA